MTSRTIRFARTLSIAASACLGASLIATGTAKAQTYTFNTIAAFDGSSGTDPSASLIVDAQGDLLGVTDYGGGDNSGTLFRIRNTGSTTNPVYSASITTLAVFNQFYGSNPQGSLAVDSSGDIYGTTTSGGPYGDGTIYEITPNEFNYPYNGILPAPSEIHDFDGTDGSEPESGVVFDGAGNILVGTAGGGVFGDGGIYELPVSNGVVGAGTLLASFQYSDTGARRWRK